MFRRAITNVSEVGDQSILFNLEYSLNQWNCLLNITKFKFMPSFQIYASIWHQVVGYPTVINVDLCKTMEFAKFSDD